LARFADSGNASGETDREEPLKLKNKIMLVAALFALASGIGIVVMIAWPDTVNAVLDDFFTWFRYFAGPIRRG
jgi:hypothetical protein